MSDVGGPRTQRLRDIPGLHCSTLHSCAFQALGHEQDRTLMNEDQLDRAIKTTCLSAVEDFLRLMPSKTKEDHRPGAGRGSMLF